MSENLDLIKTYKIDTNTAFIYKNENNSDYPYHVEMDNVKMDFFSEPSKGMIEEKYITILADEMIEKREKEITDNINNIQNADKKIKDLLDLGFSKERALMSVALTNQDKKIKSDTSATSDDWGDMDEGMESTREVDDDFDLDL